MFSKKLWLLSVPVAIIAIQGCGGGGGPTPPKVQPNNTPTPGTTATPVATVVPGTTPAPTIVPGNTPVPTSVPTSAPTAAPTVAPTVAPTMAPTPVPGGNSFTVRNSNQTATLPNGTYTTGDGVGDLLVANDIRFILTNRVGSGRRTLDVTIRDVNPNNIQVGRAYPLESADDSSPGVSNSNTGRALFDSGSGTSASGNGGSVIVDSFSFNPITNSGRATFRIVNGVFVPAGGSTESFNLTASATVTQN